MPKTIPFPTRAKPIPTDTAPPAEMPEETPILNQELDATPPVEETPKETPPVEELPQETPPVETIPDPTPAKEEMPTDLNMENVVIIDGKYIEIKPTKLKYFRNKTTAPYSYLKAIPLNEFLGYDKGVLDKTRDSDQLLYDFLVAAFDDATFVRDNYENLNADQVEKVIKIFGRINHIDEKEEAARKNREAQAKQH